MNHTSRFAPSSAEFQSTGHLRMRSLWLAVTVVWALGASGPLGRAQDSTERPSWLSGAHSSLWARSMSVVGDMNGDGVSDIALAVPFLQVDGFEGGGIMLVSGRDLTILEIVRGPRGHFGYGVRLRTGPDLDQDGTCELFVNDAADAVWVYSPSKHAVIRTFAGPALYNGAVGDRDGDGVVDYCLGGNVLSGASARLIETIDLGRCAIVSYNAELLGPARASPLELVGSYSLSWQPPIGTGVNSILVGSSTPFRPGSQVAVADVDRDGRLDVIELEVNLDHGTTLYKLSCRGWAPQTPQPHHVAATLATIPDINGDGAPDFVVGDSSEFPGSASALCGRTRGLIWKECVPLGHGNVSSGLLSDLDADSSPELVFASGDFVRDHGIMKRDGRVQIVSGRTGKVLHMLEEEQIDGLVRRNR